MVSFAVAASFSLLAQGATKVWTGGSGDWSDSANWLDGNIPVAGDTVYVSNMVSGVTINIDTEGVSISSIRFEGVGTVTLAGEALTLTGTWFFMNYKAVENGNIITTPARFPFLRTGRTSTAAFRSCSHRATLRNPESARRPIRCISTNRSRYKATTRF